MERRIIRPGDRIFARLTIQGRTVSEIIKNDVRDMTALLAELRTTTRNHRGLAKLYIRNASRGWSVERPLMLYPDYHSDRRERLNRERMAQYEYNHGISHLDRPHMIFPWETH